LTLDPAKSKVAILFFFSELDIPLSKSQIADFFVERNIINYFELQHLIVELINSDHLSNSVIGENYFYTITPKGAEALTLLKKQVPGYLRENIKAYTKENRLQLKKESQLIADYKKIADTEYEVNCKALENKMVLIDLKINVATAKQAKTICSNWVTNASEVYKAIIDLLT